MNLPLYIAKRYFLFGDKKNFINIISILTMVVVGIVTMSLVIVLSVFNGMEDLIRSLYNTFDPNIKVELVKGKSFEADSLFLAKVRKIEGVEIVTEVIEDHAILVYKENSDIVKIKGVSHNFVDQHRMDQMMVEGKLKFEEEGQQYAVIGRGVQYKLSIQVGGQFHPLRFIYANKDKIKTLDPQKSHRSINIMPGGVFAIEKQYDDHYVFVPLDFASELLGYGNKRTALEIKVRPEANIETIKQELRDVLGKEYKVLDSDEQHATLLRAVHIEKLFMQFTITVILIFASVNLFFCLSMLAINKKKDVAILFSLGATKKMVRQIFFMEGVLIGLSGALTGLVIGVIICLVQQKFGLVSMGMETSIVDAYPVKLKLSDLIVTAVTVFIITIIASIRPAISASANFNIRENL